MPILAYIIVTTLTVFAQAQTSKPILVGSDLLEAANIQPNFENRELGLSYAVVDEEEAEKLHSMAHEFGRCGGFEWLDEQADGDFSQIKSSMNKLQALQAVNAQYSPVLQSLFAPLTKKPTVEKALAEINKNNIESDVRWLSSYQSRHHRSGGNNDHIFEMKKRIEQLIAKSGLQARVGTFKHRKTGQLSLRARIVGQSKPSEVVVLGGHHDSIRQNDFLGFMSAPGADDNASGTSCLLEALRVVLAQGVQPQRTIDFMWYAAEEVGLVGSQDIATQYRNNKVDVIGALQLDMTLFPGLGDGRIALTEDFTSSWLNKVLLDLNQLYVGVEVLGYKCGYGCSDHASWHKQGYPAVFPAEATFSRDRGQMRGNRNLHTERDVIDENSSFEHAEVFTKLAVSFALELANSDIRQPY